MGGIAGILDVGAAPRAEQVRAMCAAQAHRGPDGEGLLERGPLVLGHRRQAVGPGGPQPLELPEAALALAFDGAIHDHPELRAELEAAGETFRGEGDAEVVLRAYARWGEEAFARFNGAWALALWDAERRRLVLSRDRFGIRPLYLHAAGGRVVFASELKAILTAAPEARALDLGVLGRFLQHGVQDDGQRTFFAGVRQLPPGGVLRFDVHADGLRRTASRCWSFSAEAARASYDYRDPAATLRGLLEDAVALRMRGAEPVGACLSGGLDSSAVVALAARGRAGLPTFTVRDPERPEEGAYARSVAAASGCAPREVEPDGAALVELLDLIGWYHDEPCAHPGLVTQWYAMSLAASTVRVVLDGQGGDELLLGYTEHAVPYLRSLWRTARQGGDYRERLKFWRDSRGLLGQSAPSGTLLGQLARSALGRLRRGEGPRFAPGLVQAAEEVPGARPVEPPDRLPIDQLLLDELQATTLPALLHHQDRASMAFSVDARVPFLDHRVVEFALGLDAREKVEGGVMKSILRRALRGLLPTPIPDHAEEPGAAALERWLRAAAPSVKEVLFFGFGERGYLRAADLESAWAALEAGRGDPGLLFRCLTAELWLARFVDQPPAPPLPEPGLPRPGAVAEG